MYNQKASLFKRVQADTPVCGGILNDVHVDSELVLDYAENSSLELNGGLVVVAANQHEARFFARRREYLPLKLVLALDPLE